MEIPGILIRERGELHWSVLRGMLDPFFLLEVDDFKAAPSSDLKMQPGFWEESQESRQAAWSLSPNNQKWRQPSVYLEQLA